MRDRDGRVLLSRMNPGGTAQSLSGAPPFDIVIGNAADVSVTLRASPSISARTRGRTSPGSRCHDGGIREEQR